MLFRTASRVKIESATYTGVVNRLRTMSWDIEPKDDFMHTVATRLRMLGKVIDISSPRAFVQSLVLYGYLTRED